MVRAVILAGGRGSRMGSMTKEVPKPMLSICGKPIIQYQLELLERNGIYDVTILSGYLGEQFQAFFGTGQSLGLKLKYIIEDNAMGTAGALISLANSFTEDFVLFSGDIMMNFDVQRFISWHQRREDSGLSVIVHPNNHPFDSDLVAIDEAGRVTELFTRPHPKDICFQNLSVASAYIVSPQVFSFIETEHKMDLEKHLFPRLMKADVPIYGYTTHEYLKDAGTPKRFEKVSKDTISGKLASAHRNNPRKAVFLDRDGVINVEKGHILLESDFELVSGAADAIRTMNEAGYLVIVVTNQSALAKGFLSYEGLAMIHKRLETELGLTGAYIDGLYYCPHHPERGFEGEILELKMDCNCRKPEVGMFKQAVEDYNIDLSQSFMIGDSVTDAMAAHALELKFIGVETGHGLKNVTSTLKSSLVMANSIVEASQMICQVNSQ